MTNQVNLGIVWGSTGASTDPGDINYKEGWLSEIPTYEEFNFVLQALDKNTLTLAEKGGWVWQADINYVAGATVITSAGLVAHCKTNNINQDPATDTIGSYWTSGILIGAAAPNTLTIKDGVLIKDVNPRAATTWGGNDVTVSNDNALIALNTTGGATANILVGNVSGKLVAIDVGTTAVPDGRSVALADPNVHLIYHEGNKPTQADVSGTIPDAPNDGQAYARDSLAWSVVTTTTVSDAAPAAVLGGGAGWYNLADGQLYVDINDGTSSQWVPANAPVIPELLGLVAVNNLSDVNDVPTARANLGLEIGVDVQAYGAGGLVSGDIGVTVQGYDVDTAKLDVVQSFSVAQTFTSVGVGNWVVSEAAGVLYFSTLGVNKMKIDASGNLTVVGNVTAYGTV